MSLTSNLEHQARQVIMANERFYTAFQEHDFDAMQAVWEHSDRATCVHPGRPILRGWPAIAESWRVRSDQGTLNEVVVTNASVTLTTDAAWVLVDEDLVFHDSAHTVATTNVFARHDDEWLLVGHHASLIELG